MLNRRMIEDVMSGELPTSFLKFVHTTDGTRAKYVNIKFYKDVEFKNGDLILTDECERMTIINGSEWASKELKF